MEENEIFKASMIEKQYQELEQNLQLVDTQISELEQFKDNLSFLIKSQNKEALSTLGKGVFIKSSIEDKTKLFVEVGSNIIVKKTPDETKKVLENQISRLKQARLQILAQLEIYQNQLQDLVSKLEP